MIPLRDNRQRAQGPILTYTIIGLNILIYLWDRQWHLFGSSTVFADLAMRPSQIAGFYSGSGDRFPMVTLFTSMFLHANLSHLIGNMVFLYVFGPGIEQAVGGPRFAIYYLFWGLVAGATHILVDPSSSVPTLGASGAIGGILGAYFLLFPANKVELFFPLLPIFSAVLPAWILLGLWFLWQILVPQQGVANWAHAGGFLAGMLTVLIMGGRATILTGREAEFEEDLFEHDE